MIWFLLVFIKNGMDVPYEISLEIKDIIFVQAMKIFIFFKITIQFVALNTRI